ncbi:MAG TPA: NAD(P)H-dependent oxidoreductase [Burkholderiaceae bacterium]|nr:NAD(P)H-dependent oxidoreductase [Burkholderiaceae bacterium]
MKVLTVYAHHNPRSFCHAVLERFSAGLRDAGHENEVVDLHAIGFDPVLRERDGPNWIDDSVPDDVLEYMNVKQSLMEAASNPLRRLLMKRWIGDRGPREIVRRLHALGGPRDVAEQQRKVAWAEALAFISPVYFVGFPAILKGWVERVFTLGFAFSLKPEAWRGDVRGRLPLLTHKKALIINTTIFDQAAYDSGLGAAMKVLIDDFALRYPGIQSVEHVYFHAIHGADAQTRATYLQRAYALGKDFATMPGTAKREDRLEVPA